jgi:hypothetical protein
VPRERWVRPPVVAAELPSRRLALWRYRVVSLLLLVAVAVAVILLFLRFSNVTGGEDPGIGGLTPPAVTPMGRLTDPSGR